MPVRNQLNCLIKPEERAALDRLHRARARLGLGRLGVRGLVLRGLLEALRELEGECVRRGVDYANLMDECAGDALGRRDDPPPASLYGFADDPGV